MKKTIIIMFLAVFMILSVISCGKQNDELFNNTIVYTDDYQLNDRQKDILNTMNLSENFSELSDSQKRSIQRIEQMLCYLENKYETEFVYSGYIQKGINRPVLKLLKKEKKSDRIVTGDEKWTMKKD